MRRRALLIGLGSTVAAWPLAVRGQQKAVPVIGYLSVGSPETDNIPERLVAFRRGLEKAGYIEGRNVAIEYGWAAGQYERLPTLAADLVHRQVAVIAAQNAPTAFAAKAATSTIPIVFVLGIDPVQSGFVASLGRPGGNSTGVSILGTELIGKRLEFVAQLLPTLGAVAFLTNPSNPNVEAETRSLQDAALSLGVALHILQAGTPREVEVAFESLHRLHADALVVSTDTFFTSQRAQIVALAARHVVPAIYAWRLFPASGGLMSYGSDIADSYYQLGYYTAKILNGARPGELPVQQVVRVELVINLKTAKGLGIAVPQSLLARADEVIE